MSEEVITASGVELKTRSIDLSSYVKQGEYLLKGLNKWSQGIPLVLAFFAVWEALPRLGLIDPLFLPT